MSRLLVRAKSLIRMLPTGVPTLLLGLVVGIAGLTARWQGTLFGWAWPPIVGLGLGLIYAGVHSRDPLWPCVVSAAILGYARVLPFLQRDWPARHYHIDIMLAWLFMAGPFFGFMSGLVARAVIKVATEHGPIPRTGGDSWVLPLAGLIGVLLALL